MRRIMLTAITAVLVLAVSTGVAAAQDIPPCINYSHQEEAGRVEVDLRFDPKTAAFTTLTMWWFLDEPGAAPGFYHWNHLLNGRATTAPNFLYKDDQLHAALPMVDRVSGPNWQWGDTYTFQATHYSPTTQTSYVSAYNMCRLTPRI